MNLVTLWRRGLTGHRGNGSVAQDAAQPAVERTDRRQAHRDKPEERVRRTQWFTDLMDVRRLKRMVLMLARAQGGRDGFEEPRVRNRIHTILRQELYEGRRDLDQNRREEAWRRDDLHRDYMEGRASGNGHDRKDLRDIEESRRRLMREVEILNRLRQIQPAVDRAGTARVEEERLLGSFLKLAREDARADQRERRQRGEEVTT
jgi:hypothetical protein